MGKRKYGVKYAFAPHGWRECALKQMKIAILPLTPANFSEYTLYPETKTDDVGLDNVSGAQVATVVTTKSGRRSSADNISPGSSRVRLDK